MLIHLGRSALLDMIADKQEKNSQLFDYDDDEDDNSSAYEEDMDLGELSEPSPEESSESASESSEEEIPFMVTPLASGNSNDPVLVRLVISRTQQRSHLVSISWQQTEASSRCSVRRRWGYTKGQA